jgi:iron complex outermembrane receptor protein
MRGIGTFSLGIGVEADVAVIVDDVPLGMQAGAFKDLADVGRIEVLKGPQSTLFGKSSIAGAINITTKPIGGAWKPTPPPTSPTTMNGARLQHRRLGVGHAAPARGRQQDQLRRHAQQPHHRQETQWQQGRQLSGKLEWQPLDQLTLTLTPHYNRTEKFCCSTAFTSMSPGALYRNAPQLPPSVVLSGITISPDNRDVRNDYPTGGEFHDAGTGVKLDWAFDENSALKATP